MLTETQAVARLKKLLAAQPDVKAWCAANRLNYSYVRDVRDGRRPMGDSVAKAIGLHRVHGWRER